MGRRTLLLVAALLLAAIGTGVLYVFLRATTSSLQSSGAKSGTTRVVVPRVDIPEGTPIKANLFQSVLLDAALVTDAKYVTPELFNDKLVGKTIATRPLEALTPVKLSAFGDSISATSAIPLEPNTMSIAVEVDDPARVGTFLYPTARVTLWLLRQSANDRHEAQVVLPEVTVVTIGSQGTIPQPSSTAGNTGGRGASSIVVLRVTQEQAAKVLLAQQSGDLYFTLLGANTTASPQTYDDRLLGTP